MPPAKSRKVNPLIASPLEVLSFQTTCELAFVRGGTTTEWHFLSESAVEGKWCSVGPGDPKTTRSWKSKRTGVRSNKPSCLADRQGASVNEPWKSLRVWCHSSGVTHTHTHTHTHDTHTHSDMSQNGFSVDILVCREPKASGRMWTSSPAACRRQRLCVVDLHLMTQT